MYKLEKHFDQICKAKSLTKEEIKLKLLKEYIKKNIEHCDEKFYLKNDNENKEVLIFNDTGEFYELSDGSILHKNTFDKIYKTNKSDITVNSKEFFDNSVFNKFKPFFEKIDTTKIKDDNNKVLIDITVNPTEFFNNSGFNKIKSFFEKIDTTKIKKNVK